MAKQYYGANQGDRDVDVSEATSTTSKAVEVTVDLTAGLSRTDVLVALQEIVNKITADIWPPA